MAKKEATPQSILNGVDAVVEAKLQQPAPRVDDGVRYLQSIFAEKVRRFRGSPLAHKDDILKVVPFFDLRDLAKQAADIDITDNEEGQANKAVTHGKTIRGVFGSEITVTPADPKEGNAVTYTYQRINHILGRSQVKVTSGDSAFRIEFRGNGQIESVTDGHHQLRFNRRGYVVGKENYPTKVEIFGGDFRERAARRTKPTIAKK